MFHNLDYANRLSSIGDFLRLRKIYRVPLLYKGDDFGQTDVNEVRSGIAPIV